MIAGLPMYDLPGLESHHDRLWDDIGDRLRAAGVDAPERLTRGEPLEALWTRPDLLLAQTCGYPLVKQLAGRVRVVATPIYRAPGCDGPNHRSLIVVRQDDPREGLARFRGARCAMNDVHSNSGMNLLRAEIAPLIREDEAFFESVTVTGSHSASIDAVAEGTCDIAAIDCVTHALLERLDAQRLGKVRVLARTAPAPGLPLVAAASMPDDVVLALKAALASAAKDPGMKDTLDALLIEGFEHVPAVDYLSILKAERLAERQGYARLR